MTQERTNGPGHRDTSGSEELHRDALEVLPGGVSHNVRYFEPYPIYVTRAEGSRIWDADGNEYVDFWMNHLASVLGHAHPHVVEAVVDQARNGLHYGAPSESALELGRAVTRYVPSADRVRFCASGTEATMYAGRLARAFTGRDHLLKVEGGWHGGNTDLTKAIHSPFDVPESAGLPPGAADYTHAFPLNDREAVERLFAEHEGGVAGVIVEPVMLAGGCLEAHGSFLAFLREITAEHDALLIFDEVVTGFRVSPGCYGARVGIEPDLTTLGKFLGGGLPVGALAGRTDVFETARPDVDVPPDRRVIAGGGTFSMNPMTAAAGLASLEVVEAEPVYDYTESQGERVRDALRETFDDLGIDATALGTSSMLSVHFGVPGDVADVGTIEATADGDALREFHRRLFDHGFYFLPGHGGAVSYQTGEDDLDRFLSAARAVAEGLRADGAV